MNLVFKTCRFWSELVFERKVHKCLVSYLSQAPRWYDERPNSAEQHHNTGPVVDSLHRLVLLVHVRMATYKESKVSLLIFAVQGKLTIELCYLGCLLVFYKYI